MTDEGFLTRAEVEMLAEKLDHVRDLEAEMALALAGESSQRQSDGSGHSKPGSRPPYPIHIADLADQLGNELSTTARHICEHRSLDYDGGSSWSGMAAWLIRYRFALSMIPDAGECFEALCRVIDRCRWAMSHEDPIDVSEAAYQRANRMVMSSWEIEKLARRLGERGHGLNRQRIHRLVDGGKLSPAGDDRYELGTVLEAHANAPRRVRSRYGRA